MLRQQAKLFNRLSILCDSFVLLFAFFVAYLIRNQWPKKVMPWQNYFWVLLVAIPVWLFLLYRNKFYASIRKLSFFDLITRLINVSLLAGLITAAFIYFFDRHQYSRSLFGLFVLVSFLFLVLEKISVRFLLGHLRRKGMNTRNLIIVGTLENATSFNALVRDHADWGLRTLGFIQVCEGPQKETIEGYRVLGRINELGSLCRSLSVDEVVFCLNKEQLLDVDEYFELLEELGITMRVVVDFFNVSTVRKEVNIFNETIPIITYHSKAFDLQQLLLKRLLDIAGALIGLTIFALVFPFVALGIKLDSPGPIFFSQERVRESGRRFKFWKLRSMYIDAEDRKKDLLDKNEMNGAIFKIKNDPRITPIGKFLRKTSLDEFPQFWNVLKGEMSLVGTRPPTPDEVANYENWHRRRISIKPGLTGMWQTNGRNKIKDFNEVVKLDLFYIDNWTLWLDIKIILKTFWVVLNEEGSS